MKLAASFCIALLAAAQIAAVPAANAPAMTRSALGTSAVVDRSGRLWVAYAQSAGAAAEVIVQRSDDDGLTWNPPLRVNDTPEPVAAEGENRPKLAFGTGGEIYVSWTAPTSAQFTGDIRFARSLDGGKTWSAPTVVHRDRQLITHRFESMLVDAAGRVWVAWIDKRSGVGIYYAYSDDRGASWRGDFKLADSSCECCRIALAADAQGRVAAMWRHVFEPSERDHAFAFLGSSQPSRVTFDRWRIDACPHHGPSLAFAADGTRHAVWFNQVNSEGRAFYGRLTKREPERVQALPAGATHADIAVVGSQVAIAWKRFDGTVTRIESWLSNDGGRAFSSGPVLQTAGDSDQPRLVSAGPKIMLVWRSNDGIAVRALAADAVKPFGRDTLAAIERKYAQNSFWLVLWDLECPYCMKSLSNLAAVQREHPEIKVVTIATDPIAAADEIAAQLVQLGIRSDAYAFADAPREALQFAIDPSWLGEKPRAYLYGGDGKRVTVSGVILPTQATRHP
jgi:hypothetical protein